MGDGLRRLREDLAKTVERRVSLLLEDMAEEDEADARAPLPTDGVGAWALPRRAHFEIGGHLSLCDYVAAGEDASDFFAKATELLGHNVSTLSLSFGPPPPSHGILPLSPPGILLHLLTSHSRTLCPREHPPPRLPSAAVATARDVVVVKRKEFSVGLTRGLNTPN